MGAGGSVLDCIRTTHPEAVVDKCREHNCRLDMRGLPNRVVLRGEKLAGRSRGEPIADCIVFVEHKGRLYVAVVELKDGRPEAAEVIGQVTSGARHAEAALADCLPETAAVRFRAAVLHGRSFHKTDFGAVKKARIGFRGRTTELVPRPCGADGVRLAELLGV